MERGRGDSDRGFRPFRGRGGFRGVERGRFISRGRRPFRGFQIKNRGSLRGVGQFFQASRPSSNQDLRNRIQDREQERAKEPARVFEVRYSRDSSDAESVSSEYDASSARYRQHDGSYKGKQRSISPLLDQFDKDKSKERTPFKRRVYTDGQHLRQDLRNQDVKVLNESMKRQSLNDPGEFPLVTRIGRQGHIQRGLPRLHGSRGNKPFNFYPKGDNTFDIYPKKTFHPRGRGYASHTVGRFDDMNCRSAHRRDDSKERDRERTLHKEPKVKKQQASWIPMEDEEEKGKEKPVSVQSIIVPTEKKKGAVMEKELTTGVQSKVVLLRETDSTKQMSVQEQNSSLERKAEQSKNILSLQEDTYSELPPSEKDSSVLDLSEDSSAVEEGNENNSSTVHDQARNTWRQEENAFNKESHKVPARPGSGFPYFRSKREHVLSMDIVDHARKSGSLERDEHSWIGLEGNLNKSLSEESEYCLKKDESNLDMDYLRKDEGEWQLKNASFNFMLDRQARRFPFGDRGDLSKSLLESVRSSSKEGDDLYRSDDESHKDDIYRRELEEALQAPSPREEAKRDDTEHMKTPDNSSFRKDGHVSRKEERVHKSIHSSSCRREPSSCLSSLERGKVHFKVKSYGILNKRERCTANMRKSDYYRSDSKDKNAQERRESNEDRADSRERHKIGKRQRSHDRFDFQEMHAMDRDERVYDRTDISKRHSLSEIGNSHDWSDSLKRYSMNEGERDHNKSKLDCRERNMNDRRGQAADWSDSSDHDGQLSRSLWYMIKTRDLEISHTIEKHIVDSRESANVSFESKEEDSMVRRERAHQRSAFSEKYSVIDSYSNHSSSDSEESFTVYNREKDVHKLVGKHSKARRQSHSDKSDSSNSNSVSDSDSDSDHDRPRHKKKKGKRRPEKSHPRDTYTTGRRQKYDNSYSSESVSEHERESDNDRSDSLHSYTRKKHRKPQKKHSKEREKSDQYSTVSSERSESSDSYSRSEKKYHERSKFGRRYAVESSISSQETTDSSESYRSYTRSSYHDYTKQKHDRGYDRSHSSASHSVRSRSSDQSDSRDSYPWNRRETSRDGSSSRERYTAAMRDSKGDSNRYSDFHRSSSRDGSHSGPFKSPTLERRFKYKESAEHKKEYGERSNVHESPVKKIPYAKRFPPPKPRVGYGRHIFPFFQRSPRSRSRSRSVSVARSKVSFYEKIKMKSNLWLRAQADLIKEAEKKLIQESISQPPSKRTGKENETTVDLVKATESLQITVEHVTKGPVSASQDAVILQEHITMSKSSDSDQSPKKKSLCHLTMGKEHKLSACASSTAVEVFDDRREMKMTNLLVDSGKWISKVIEKRGQEMKVKYVQEPGTEAEEWNSRQVFMKETTPTKSVETLTKASHGPNDIPEVGIIDEPGKQNENSSVDKVPDVKGLRASVGQMKASNTMGAAVQNTFSFQTLWKKKITSKPGIKVILAGKTVPSVSSPKKSFWNDRQKRRVNNGFGFSPVRKTVPGTEFAKTVSIGTPHKRNLEAVCEAVPKSSSRNQSGPLKTTDKKVTELSSKERTPQKKHVESRLQKSTDKQPSLSLTPQSPKILSKKAATKVRAQRSLSEEQIIDIFENEPSSEVGRFKLKESIQGNISRGQEAADVKNTRREADHLNIPLTKSKITSPEKSCLTATTDATNLSSPQKNENVTTRSKIKDRFESDLVQMSTDDVHSSSGEKRLASDKPCSDKSDSVFIRGKDNTAEASHSDHEEVDMDLEDEEPDISLEEDTSWMGTEQVSSLTCSTAAVPYFMPGASSTAFTSAWGPRFGSYPPFPHPYIPMVFPHSGFDGNWFSTQSMHYGSQQYWSQQSVDKTHTQKVPVSDAQVSQNVSQNSAALTSVSTQDLLSKDSLNTSQLQSQQESVTVQVSGNPVPAPVQPPKDQTASSVLTPPVPPEDPVPSSELPPLPEDPYPFPLPDLTTIQPPIESDLLLVPVPVQPTKGPVVSLYLPMSQPESVPLSVPTPDHEHATLVSLVSPTSDAVPSPVPPPEDLVCFPVPPPKENIPCLVSPPGRSVTLPILSAGASVLSLMPAPVIKSKEIPSHFPPPQESVSVLTSAPVTSPQKSVSVMSPLIAQVSVPLPVPAPVPQSKTFLPAPVQPPKLSPNAVGKGSPSHFGQDVVSSLIPPLQHIPVSVGQDTSLKRISFPLPVPPPQEWSAVKTSSLSEPSLPENPAPSPVPIPVPSPQQSPTQQSNFASKQGTDFISPVKSSPTRRNPDSFNIYSQKSKPSPAPCPQKSPTVPNTDHSKQISLVVSLFRQPKTGTRKQGIHQPSLVLSVPTSPVSNKSCHSPLTDVQVDSARYQHLSLINAQSSETSVGNRRRSKDLTCSSSDNSPNTVDSSPTDVPQSPSFQCRDPRLQKRALKTDNKEQGSELFNLELKAEHDRNPSQSTTCSEKTTQSRHRTYSIKPKRKTSHLDAQSKCLKQLKSILKSSLAKSTAHSSVPKKLSKPKIHEPESLAQNTKSSQNISQFDAPMPNFKPTLVPNPQETCQKTLSKPQLSPDADYSDVPMDIDETENSNPEFVSNRPVLPETGPLIINPPDTHGTPVSIPTSLPYASASNTANSSNPPNKPSRDPRLQVQSRKYEDETRMALKTLFKVLQRPQAVKTTPIASQRQKPVAKTAKSLLSQGRSSQGTHTGPGSTSQTFGIVKSPDSKKIANAAVINPKHSENEASTSRLKPQDLFPVNEGTVGDNAYTGDYGGDTGKEDWRNYQAKGTVVKETVLSTSSIPVTSVPLVSSLPVTSSVPLASSLPVTSPLPVTSSIPVTPTQGPDTVTAEVTSTGGSSDINVYDYCNPFVLTSGDDDQVTPAVGVTSENQVLVAPLIGHREDWDNTQSSDETGQWLAEPPVPKETQSSSSVKPLERSIRSASDQGIFNKLAPLPESSPSDVERSPVYLSTSFDLQDMKRGSGLSMRPLSSCSDSRGPLSTEKVRGMSHKDVSEWVKKSSAQCLVEPETTSLGRSHSQGKKKHGEKEKRRHHSGSSGSTRLNSSGVKTTDGDRSKMELGGKLSGKSPKGNIRKFLSHDGSPRNREEFSRSKSVDSSRWVPEISNPLGSYRIPKLSSATTDTPFKEPGEDRDKEEKNKKGASKSQDGSSDNVGSESDDDLFNETPAFLKEFEETRKTILAAGMMPGTPDNILNESMHSDDSLVLDEPTVSYKPTSKSTDGKSTFSLDALLAEKVEHEVTDQELNTIQKELKEGIKLGGFVRLAEAEVDDDSDDELLPEHHQKLQYFQVSENTIQDQHPGEVVLQPGKFPCLYSEVLSPVRCGFRPSESFLEKHLANIHPDALTDLLTTDMLSICFHKITAQEEVLRWIFFIMSVHRDSCVIQGCKKLVFDIIHTQLSVDETSSTWAPSVLDVLKVLVNFGGDTSDLLQAQTLYSQEDIRDAIIPENDDNLISAGDNNNIPVRSYAENVREFLQTVAFALQGRPQYTAAELNVLLVMMAKASLEKEFTDNVLLYEFSVLASSILPCYKEDDWTSVMPSLCYQLSELTSHHHNFVYLAQLFPHGKRGSSIQRRLAYLLLMKMLQPDTRVSREQLVGYKLHQLSIFFPALRELAADDLYALSSAVALLDIAVGNEPLKGSEKNDLQHLMELLRTLTSDVRDNVRRLDHTRVKDLMVRISSKWTVTLQTTTSKQRNLFAWTKQKSPQKMQVQRLETGASDVETDDEEDEEEEEEDEEGPAEAPGDEADEASENFPVSMEIDVGAGGDVSTRLSATDDGKQDNDFEIESGETSSGPDEDVRNANMNNNGDVGDKDMPGVSGSSVTINSEVRVVLEDICMSGKTNEDEMSSDDESLPELDINL